MSQKHLLTPDKIHHSPIQFKQTDVLNSPKERMERLKTLNAAMKLGNHHKHKVRLSIMNASDQLIEIKAKVWSVTEKYVILKNSIMIPISSIMIVNFM